MGKYVDSPQSLGMVQKYTLFGVFAYCSGEGSCLQFNLNGTSTSTIINTNVIYIYG